MINVVARGGIEPPTQGFSDPCSTILIIYKQPLTEFAFPNPTLITLHFTVTCISITCNFSCTPVERIAEYEIG